MNKDNFFYHKLIIYIAGIFILSIGSNLFLNAALGVAPSCAIALTLTFLFPGSYAFFNFLINILLLGLESLLLHSFKKTQMIQLLITFLYSLFIQLLAPALSFLQPQTFFQQILLALLACIVMGIGITLTLLSSFVVMPMEGFVGAVAFRLHKEFGRVRVKIDCFMTLLAILISLFFVHSLQSVGLGTILTALLTGNIVSICTKLWKAPLDVFMGFSPKPIIQNIHINS